MCAGGSGHGAREDVADVIDRGGDEEVIVCSSQELADMYSSRH
jgi:hypothetical protein